MPHSLKNETEWHTGCATQAKSDSKTKLNATQANNDSKGCAIQDNKNSKTKLNATQAVPHTLAMIMIMITKSKGLVEPSR